MALTGQSSRFSFHLPALRKLLEQPQGEDRITFSHWAKAEEVLEISEQEQVDNLEPHYIWTAAYAQSKLHWKPMLPLESASLPRTTSN